MPITRISRSLGAAKRYLLLFLYYGCIRHLPASSFRHTRWIRHIRYVFAKRLFSRCGDGVNVEKGAYFGTGSQIVIGDYSGIGIDCEIHGPCMIGKNVMMGPEVIIYTYGHVFSRTDTPIRLQGRTESVPITIQDDVWIGRRVMICGGGDNNSYRSRNCCRFGCN